MIETVEDATGNTVDLTALAPWLGPVQLTGTSGADYLLGDASADTMAGHGGDDVIVGGMGVDLLVGGSTSTGSTSNGNDTYVWSLGDSNDTLRDGSKSLTETDRLLLTDVASTQVALSRLQGEDDLLITILPSGEVLTDLFRFNKIAYGYGIEVIEFGADGVTWDLETILAKTSVNGTAANDVINGTGYAFDENIYGHGGNDTIYGGGGDDVIVGGLGVDSLYGGVLAEQESNGSDTYVWSKGDGNDVIRDSAQSLTEVDTLRLTDVASGDVTLSRASNNVNLIIETDSANETITVADRFKMLPMATASK
ncbi:MAG: hypothetical protein AAF999_18030 [Pseudomonadota bacterium]